MRRLNLWLRCLIGRGCCDSRNLTEAFSIFFSVRDQGIGIPRVELKRIFNRFYRIQSSATGKVTGTGLGLFIVRSVVRRYGGDAFAESQGEGLGSTFTIRLPRVYRA